MFTRAAKSFIGRTLTALWHTVDDCNMVLVIIWIEVTLVTNEDITVVEGEREGFVLGSFQDTIHRAKLLQK